MELDVHSSCFLFFVYFKMLACYLKCHTNLNFFYSVVECEIGSPKGLRLRFGVLNVKTLLSIPN